MSNRLFQGVIHQMRDAMDRTVGVIDETGAVISCSELGRIGEVLTGIPAELFADQVAVQADGCTFRAFGSQLQAE